MRLERERFAALLVRYHGLTLVSESEVRETLALFGTTHPLREALEAADSVHLHVRVDDTTNLPRERVRSLGGTPENEQAGYVKFTHVDGLNMIFSSINVAAEDLITDAPRTPRPFLDHLGVDLRSTEPAVVRIFNAIPGIAKQLEWEHVSQGGDGHPVYCCHTEVGGKHWLFPRRGGGSRPIEVASGPLGIHGAKMGCDLRPIDPGHPFADKMPTCCGGREGDTVSLLRSERSQLLR
jgi:hypothetical protein